MGIICKKCKCKDRGNVGKIYSPNTPDGLDGMTAGVILDSDSLSTTTFNMWEVASIQTSHSIEP
jgi:hypothetical protein